MFPAPEPEPRPAPGPAPVAAVDDVCVESEASSNDDMKRNYWIKHKLVYTKLRSYSTCNCRDKCRLRPRMDGRSRSRHVHLLRPLQTQTKWSASISFENGLTCKEKPHPRDFVSRELRKIVRNSRWHSNQLPCFMFI